MTVRDDARALLDFSRDLREREAAEARRRELARKRRTAALQRARPRTPVLPTYEAPDTAVAQLADRQEAALQARLDRDRRFNFWPMLGEIPVCGPGEQEVAAVFHRKIVRVLDAATWTHDERSYLLKLEKLWADRAAGKDVRFALAGNKRGRLDRETERRIKMLRRTKS